MLGWICLWCFLNTLFIVILAKWLLTGAKVRIDLVDIWFLPYEDKTGRVYWTALVLDCCSLINWNTLYYISIFCVSTPQQPSLSQQFTAESGEFPTDFSWQPCVSTITAPMRMLWWWGVLDYINGQRDTPGHQGLQEKEVLSHPLHILPEDQHVSWFLTQQ